MLHIKMRPFLRLDYYQTFRIGELSLRSGRDVDQSVPHHLQPDKCGTIGHLLPDPYSDSGSIFEEYIVTAR